MRRALPVLLVALGCTKTSVFELPTTNAQTAVWLTLRGVGAELHPTHGFAIPLGAPRSILAQDLSGLEPGTRVYVALLGPTLEELHLDPGEVRWGECSGQSVDLRGPGASMLQLVDGELSALDDAALTELASSERRSFYVARNDRDASLCALDPACPAVPSVQIPWFVGAPPEEQGGQVSMITGLSAPDATRGLKRVLFEQVPATDNCQEGAPCAMRPPVLLLATRDPEGATPSVADVRRFPVERPAGILQFTAGRYLEPGAAVLAGTRRGGVAIYIVRADPPGFEGPIATASTTGPLSALLARRGAGGELDLWATSSRGALLHAEGGSLVEVVPRLYAPGRVDVPVYVWGSLALAKDGAILAAGVGRPGDRRVVTTLDLRSAIRDLVRVKDGTVTAEAMSRVSGRDYSTAIGVALYDHNGTPTEVIAGAVFNNEFDSSQLGVVFGPPIPGQPWPLFADPSIVPARLGEFRDVQPIEQGFVVVGSNFGAAERGTVYRYDARRTLADPQAGAVECSGSGDSWFRVIVLGPNEWVTTTTPKDDDSHRILGARMAWWIPR